MGLFNEKAKQMAGNMMNKLVPPRDTQNIHICREGEQPQSKIKPAEYVLKNEVYAGELKEYAYDGELLNAISVIMMNISTYRPDLQQYLIDECDKYLMYNGLYSDGGAHEWLNRLNRYHNNWCPESKLIRFGAVTDVEYIKTAIEGFRVHESDIAFVLMLQMQWACPDGLSDGFMGGSKSEWRELSGQKLYAWWERNGEKMLDVNVTYKE